MIVIVKGLFNLIYNFLSVVLTPFEIIPNMPTTIDNYINGFIDFLFNPISLFLYFIPRNLFLVSIPVLIVIVNMEHIWDGIIWILKKLPFIGIE